MTFKDMGLNEGSLDKEEKTKDQVRESKGDQQGRLLRSSSHKRGRHPRDCSVPKIRKQKFIKAGEIKCIKYCW